MRSYKWILLLFILSLHAVQAAPLSSLLSAVTNTANLFSRDDRDVSSGSNRTLYSIIRSCLFTIVACVYRAIHPNIPSPTASTWGTFRERLIIMAYMLLVPELVIYWAAEQWSSARDIAKYVNVEVTTKVTKAALCPYNHPRCLLCDPEKFHWTAVHGHYLQMGGYVREDNDEVLTSEVLVVLVRKRQISVHDLNRCTEKRIKDRSKGDVFSKAILTLQTSWFILQCIARLAQHLDLAELEIITVAFCVLNVATFLLWWSKPLDVHSPTYLQIHIGAVTMDPPDEKDDQPSPPPKSTPFNPLIWFLTLISGMFAHLGELVGFRGAYDLPEHAGSVGRFYRERPETDYRLFFCENMGLGVVFGAIHFIAWSFPFPTKQEQVLWRVFTVIATAVPFTFGILWLVMFQLFRRLRRNWLASLIEGLIGIVATFILLFYFVARIGLFLQAVIALRKPPASIFDDVVWSSFFPHL